MITTEYLGETKNKNKNVSVEIKAGKTAKRSRYRPSKGWRAELRDTTLPMREPAEKIKKEAGHERVWGKSVEVLNSIVELV